MRGEAGADVGALVQPQRAGGIELLVGVVRDPAWGLVLAVGFGGIWVEILKDTALLVLPAGRDQILSALKTCAVPSCSTARAARKRPTWTRSPMPSPRSPLLRGASATAWRPSR